MPAYKEFCFGSPWGKGGLDGPNIVGRAIWRCIVVTKGRFFFLRAPFCRSKSVVKDCFTGQSPGKAISIPAAPDVQGNPAKSKPRLLRGGLGHGWCSGVGLGLGREAGW